MRVLFMGTPQIAATILELLAKEHEICGVFCQPDKPVGRKAVITPPVTKIVAQSLGIPVFQLDKMRDGKALSIISRLVPELIVVVAYGKILPKEILEAPKYGCVNIHASILPKYRGSSPLQQALLNDETDTGITVMYMKEGIDTGDIIAVRKLHITDEDDADTMYARAAVAGAELLFQVLADIESGGEARTKQNDCDASFAPPLTKEMGLFNFTDDARDIFNKVRALCRWPVAYFYRSGKKVKVHSAAFSRQSGATGEILSLNPFTVAAKNGAIVLISVTPEGKKTMNGKDFAVGQHVKIGDYLL